MFRLKRKEIDFLVGGDNQESTVTQLCAELGLRKSIYEVKTIYYQCQSMKIEAYVVFFFPPILNAKTEL
jgi:hypothetical protein